MYGLNDVSDVWSADTLTWHNAPANDKTGAFADPGGVYGGKELGKIAVNGSGVYTLDVTEFINYLKGGGKDYATFILCAAIQPGLPILEYQFDDLESFESCEWNSAANKVYNSAHYRPSGDGLAEISTAEFYTNPDNSSPSGKSIRIFGKNGWERVQLYNTITKDRDLDNSDIGRSFKITFKAKAKTEGSLNLCIMSPTESGTFAPAAHPINTQWQDYVYEYTLMPEMVAGQFGLFSFLTSGLKPTAEIPAEIFVDDLLVTETTGSEITVSSNTNLYKLDYKFDELTSFPFDYTSDVSWSKTGKYRCSGGTKNADLSTDYNHTKGAQSGKSLKFISTAGHGRLKFYNTFSTDRELNSDDIGRTFEVSYWARSNKGGTFTSSLMSVSDNIAFQPAVQTIEADTDWKQYTHRFIIDEEIVANKAFMYSIVTNGMSPVSSTDEIFLYIDDFSITELPTGENSALHVTFSNGTDSRTAGACEQGYISGGADALYGFRQHENCDWTCKLCQFIGFWRTSHLLKIFKQQYC